MATSYIAPLCSQKLKKNSVFEYDYYLIVDELPKIRETIYNINSKLQQKKKTKNRKKLKLNEGADLSCRP